MKSWSFLRSNLCPKYLGDSPPRYFQHLLAAVDRLHIDLTLLAYYKVKTLYSKLALPSPKWLPSTAAWEKRLKTRLHLKNIWPQIYGGLSTNWRIAHEIVKTRRSVSVNWVAFATCLSFSNFRTHSQTP